MYQTIIKRAIGAAFFASVLVIVIPWLFKGEGDVLSAGDSTYVTVEEDEQSFPLESIAAKNAKQRSSILEVQQTNSLERDESGRLVSNKPIPNPLLDIQPDAPVAASNAQQPQGSAPVVQQSGDQPELTLGQRATQQASTSASLSQTTAPQAPSQQPQQGNGEQATQPTQAKADKPAKQELSQQAAAKPQQQDQLAAFIAQKNAGWALQVGLFSQPSNAQKQKTELQGKIKDSVFIQTITIKGKRYQGVYLGPYAQQSQAQRAKQRAETILGETVYIKTMSDIR